MTSYCGSGYVISGLVGSLWEDDRVGSMVGCATGCALQNNSGMYTALVCKDTYTMMIRQVGDGLSSHSLVNESFSVATEKHI